MLPSLSSSYLEALTCHCLSVNANWRSPLPKLTRTSRFQTKVNRVFQVKFLNVRQSVIPGSSSTDDNHPRTERVFCEEDEGDGRYIFTAGYFSNNVLCLQIWDLEAGTTGEDGLVGEWIEPARLASIAICEGQDIQSSELEDNDANSSGTLIAFCIHSLSESVILLNSLCI